MIKYDYATSDLLGTDGAYMGLSFEFFSELTNYKGSNLEKIGVYYITNEETLDSNELVTINLNENFLKNIRTEWASKIFSTTWKATGENFNGLVISPSDAYQIEVKNIDKNEEVGPYKIGLIYMTDYAFSVSPEYWTNKLSSYSNDFVDENWMHMGLFEPLMISLVSGWTINDDGAFSSIDMSDCSSIRPSFYLNEDVNYVSGNGTQLDPIRIS